MKKSALSADALAYFRQQGARGGTVGSQSLTAAQRKARASKAGQASARAKKKKQATIDYSDMPELSAVQLASMRRVGQKKKRA